VTPKNWRDVELREVCEFAYGKSLPADARSGSGFPVFGSNGQVGLHHEALTAGETIIIGRKGSFGEVHFSPGPCSPIDTTYYITENQTKAYLPWLARRLRSLGLDRLNRAAAIPGLNREDAYRQRLLLPPLSEQKRIAGILDAADSLRAKRREAIAQLDTLVQSTFLDMFGDCDRPPVSIGEPSFGDPSGFVALSDYARLATGHTPDRDEPTYWGGTIPWISLTDIRTLDGTVATETLQSVTEAGIKNSSAVMLPTGTVCFSRTASVGFVTVMGREMATSQDFVNWVCGNGLDPIYLMWALRLSRPYLLSKSSGSTHKTIYYRHAEQFQVFLPSIDLQRRFATIVESVERQKARMRAHLAELDALFASLQSRAFKGAL
jgi:type I restriction enzyme, S subunit